MSDTARLLALALCSAPVAALASACAMEVGDAGDADGDTDPAESDGVWIPAPLTADRFAVFYQFSPDILRYYKDPARGLPMSSEHAYIFTVSHASAPASRSTADAIHGA